LQSGKYLAPQLTRSLPAVFLAGVIPTEAEGSIKNILRNLLRRFTCSTVHLFSVLAAAPAVPKWGKIKSAEVCKKIHVNPDNLWLIFPHGSTTFNFTLLTLAHFSSLLYL